jgi:peroxiredoxin
VTDKEKPCGTLKIMRTPGLAPTLALLSLAAPIVQAATLPRPAPDFVINLAPGMGAPIRLSQYKGKTVVLAFILTYCSHCQKSVGFLTKDQQEFGPRGLQVLASAIDAPTAVPAFIQQFRPPFPVGFNTTEEAMGFMQHVPMMTPYMPMIAFIDKDGVIRAQFEGNDPFLSEGVQERNLRDKIEELLKPAMPGKKTVSKTKGTSAAAKKQSN